MHEFIRATYLELCQLAVCRGRYIYSYRTTGTRARTYRARSSLGTEVAYKKFYMTASRRHLERFLESTWTYRQFMEEVGGTAAEDECHFILC